MPVISSFIYGTRERRIPAAAMTIGVWAAALAMCPKPVALGLAAPVVFALLIWWTIQQAQRWLALFFTAVLLTPPFSLPGIDANPHIAPFFVALGILVAILRIEEWKPCSGTLPLALLIFTGILLASIAFAVFYEGPAVAGVSFARLMLFAISPWVFAYSFSGPGRNIDSIRFARLLFFLAVAAALYACLDFRLQFPAPAKYSDQFVWLDAGVFRRAQGLFYEASTLGNFCAFFIVMVAVALCSRRDARPCSAPVLVAGGVVCAMALIFSYSRASVVCVVVALAALAALRGMRVRRMLCIAALCAVAAGLLTYMIFPSFSNDYWGRISSSFTYFDAAPDKVLSGRLTVWSNVWNVVLREPLRFLLGIGYKALPYSGIAGAATAGDNTWLTLLVETGIPGFAAFVLLNLAILRTSWRAAHSLEPRRAFLGAWIFCFWAGEVVQMASGDLITYWRVLPVYFQVLAMATREGSE